MPTPLVFDTPDFQANETLKAFDSTDALATSYLELKTKVDGGSIDLLPEEIRKDSTISKFKTVPELAKGYVAAQKLIGGIKKAPESVDGYKFTPLANLNPNLKADGILTQFKGIFHKAGLPNDSADIVQQEVLTVLSNGMAQQEKAKSELAQKNETILRGKWGADYDKKFDGIVKTLTRAGGAEAIAETEAVAKALKGSPKLLEALGNIVGLLSEDSIGKLGEPAQKEITGATEALAEIQKMNAEIVAQGSKHPFNDAKHPEHQATKDKMTKLFATAYPQQ